LFIYKLLFVRQHLPFAAATHAKMLAKRINTERGGRHQLHHFAFGPAFLFLHNPRVHYVSRYSILYKQHFPVFKMGNTFTLCCICIDLNINYRLFFLSGQNLCMTMVNKLQIYTSCCKCYRYRFCECCSRNCGQSKVSCYYPVLQWWCPIHGR